MLTYSTSHIILKEATPHLHSWYASFSLNKLQLFIFLCVHYRPFSLTPHQSHLKNRSVQSFPQSLCYPKHLKYTARTFPIIELVHQRYLRLLIIKFHNPLTLLRFEMLLFHHPCLFNAYAHCINPCLHCASLKFMNMIEQCLDFRDSQKTSFNSCLRSDCILVVIFG